MPAIAAFIVLEGLVAFQVFSAYQNRFLTVPQMRQNHINEGLPFVYHFAMWSDFFLISPLCAYVTGRTIHYWRRPWLWISLAIGLLSTIILHLLYVRLSTLPEAHVQNHHLTSAGYAHAVYMAIAIAVFVQFLCFTGSRNVSPALLRITSVLLFLHAFVGTHMVLGIYKLYQPLDWYPEQPLQSYFGWITIAIVGIGLAERNFGLGFILWFVNLPYPETDEDYLKLLDFACKVVNRGYFTFMAGLALGAGDNPLSIILIVLLGFIYYLSRLSVSQELEIGRTLYPADPGRVPSELLMKDRRKITFEVLLFMTAYVVAAWTAHCVIVVSLLMFVIACVDFNTRREINLKTRQYFGDPKYAPREGEADFDVIIDRRVKASRFLFNRPHLLKESAKIMGFGIALAIANFSYLNSASHGNYIGDLFYCVFYRASDGTDRLSNLAYLAMILTLILNEIITIKWRIVRDFDFGRLKGRDSLLLFFTRQEQPGPR